MIAQTKTQAQTQLFEYVLVLWTGELEEQEGYAVPKETETVFPVFAHEPSESDWQAWLTGWFRAGYQTLTQPRRINSQDDEF